MAVWDSAAESEGMMDSDTVIAVLRDWVEGDVVDSEVGEVKEAEVAARSRLDGGGGGPGAERLMRERESPEGEER
jgi:hypothetical protein